MADRAQSEIEVVLTNDNYVMYPSCVFFAIDRSFTDYENKIEENKRF